MPKRLAEMMDCLAQFSHSDGTLPLIGDDDGGRALAIVSQNYRSFTFDEEMFWLGGEMAGGMLPRRTHAFYSNAGYAIQRSGASPHESQVIFDCGGLGMLNGGHGHADALSLIVSVDGTEILTDPGTFVYNGSPKWRNFFRSTHAHNTVVVDDSSQSVPGGTFKWQRKAHCQVLQHLSDKDFDYVEAEHDGYRGAPFHVMHRRGLLHLRHGLWAVIDDLQGPSNEHTFDFYYHFSANAKLSVEQERDSILRVNARAGEARLQLLMCASNAITANTVQGQTEPIQGWVSSLYGEKSPAPTLRASLRAPAPTFGMCIMLPSHSDADRDSTISTRSIRITSGSALACEADYGQVKDIFVLSTQDQPISIMDFTLRGRFFWLRQTSGQLTRILGIDCQEVRHRDQVLMCDETSVPHFDFERKS